jgi:hypothetical protein
MDTHQQLYGWLLARVRDGGRNALAEIAALAKDEREVLIKGPAMAAMLCWKEGGIEKIVEIAQANPTSKTLSSAYKLLSATAAGGEINLTLLFLHNDELAALISDAVANGNLRQCAREYLSDLLQSLDTFDLLIPLGTAFSQMGLIAEQGAAELIRAMSSRWLRVGPSLLKEYRGVGYDINEGAAREFLSEGCANSPQAS